MKDSGFPLFIGFDTLEEWLTSIDHTRPVFANLVIEYGKIGLYDIRTDQKVIIVAQPITDLVYYCRLPISELQYMGSKPFNPDHDQRMKQAQQAWEIVETWLLEQGLTFHKAVIAVPQYLKLLEGKANFLIFDNDTQNYQRQS